MSTTNKIVNEMVEKLAMEITHSKQGEYAKNEAFVRTIFNEVIEHTAVACGCLSDFPGEKFIGGCGGPVKLMEVYACVDCSAPFHRKCLLKHLKHEMVEESLTKMPLEEAFKKIDEVN